MCPSHNRHLTVRRLIRMFTVRALTVIVVCLTVTLIIPKSDNHKILEYTNNPSISKFREYLRIDTSAHKNLDEAVDFWKRQADEIGLQFSVYKPAGKPICVLTWNGTNPALKTIMLNSHMDVVPVDENEWKYPPFEAHMDGNGDIYGRGAQDTKDIAIQYVEAIRNLKEKQIALERTIHITLMPDEETGGYNGMTAFVNTDEFKKLNIGFALDEGLASADGNMFLTFVDRRPWQIAFHVKGDSGHGSGMPDNTAAERVVKLMNVINQFREKQQAIMKSHDVTDFGAYTSVNINMINGGQAPNVIANKFDVVVDTRLAVNTTPDKMMHLINSWIHKAAGNKSGAITTEYYRQVNRSDATPIDDTFPFLVALREVTGEMGIGLKLVVCPATSDMVKIRNAGIPAYGFAPKTYTVSRIHGADEYLNALTFLKGIDVYQRILMKLGNLK